MSKIITTLSLFLIPLIICEIQGVPGRIDPDCITPDEKPGSCVDVRYCVTIMTALLNGDHLTSAEIAKYLRESQCGIEANSQKVCCHVESIDFGEVPTVDSNPTEAPLNSPIPTKMPTLNLPAIQQPPPLPTYNQQQTTISDLEKCGKLEQQGTPYEWIAELWYKQNKLGKNFYESKCLGTVISLKHVIVPAHCVASLPAHISLDHLIIENDEYLIGKIFIHASYNQPKFANDIAIIELDVELSRSKNPKASDPQQITNAICLDKLEGNAQQSKSSIAIMKTEQGPLRHANIALIPNNQCSMFFDQQFTDLTSSQFCANIHSNETDISSFIGAIIMTYDNVRQQYSLKGFTTTSVRTEQSFDDSKPYIFTDVEQYLTWIKAALGGSVLQNNLITDSPRDDDDDDAPDTKILESLYECPLSTGNGRCVLEEDCKLYSMEIDQRSEYEEFLKSLKCSYRNDQLLDGVCCPEQFINTTSLQAPDFNVRFEDTRTRRQGRDLLDMNQCGLVDPSRRIVGGRQADLREFPWFALLKYKVGRLDKFTCGGSLISSRYVLTCAHCITQLPSGYEVAGVRLGEYDLTTNPDCKNANYDGESECNPPILDVDIESLIPHSRYNNPKHSNDIGLVRMAQNVEFKRGSIIPICLPINNEMQQTLTNKSTVAGFGFTEHGRDSNVLMKIVVPKVPRETCQSFHRPSIQLSEGHACYGGEGIIDSCKGLTNHPFVDGQFMLNYR
ncbi:hypothetical protein ACKWTF_006955 [Chironomus riparius]